MDVEVAAYLVSLLQSAFLLCLFIYFIITLSDLECDYINATSCCSRLNRWVKIEMLVTIPLTMVWLFTGHYYLSALTVPLSAWLIYRYARIPAGSMGVYDATDIHNSNLIKYHLKETVIKLVYHLISFFIYLIWRRPR